MRSHNELTDAEILKAINDRNAFTLLIPDDRLTPRTDPDAKMPDLRKFSGFFRFTEIIKHYPECTDKIITLVLNDPDSFKKVFNSSSYFLDAVNQLPNYANSIIVRLVNDPEYFVELVHESIINLVNNLPEYLAEKIFSGVLNNPDSFNKLANDYHSLEDALAKLPPNYGERILDKIMDNPDLLEKFFIKTELDLSSPEPGRLDNYHMDLINGRYHQLQQRFPTHPLFQTPDFDPLPAIVKARWDNKKRNLAQVGTAAVHMHQFKSRADTLFAKVPRDVLIKIAKHTADEGVLTDEEANKKAMESFKPPTPTTKK